MCTDIIHSIPNPLASLSCSEVLAEVEDFVREKGLGKFMRLFKTAALVAHQPTEYESINDPIAKGEFDYVSLRPLEEEELEFLRDEHDKRFRHPRELYWTIVLCSVGAAVQCVCSMTRDWYCTDIDVGAGIRRERTVPIFSFRQLLVYPLRSPDIQTAMPG